VRVDQALDAVAVAVAELPTVRGTRRLLGVVDGILVALPVTSPLPAISLGLHGNGGPRSGDGACTDSGGARPLTAFGRDSTIVDVDAAYALEFAVADAYRTGCTCGGGCLLTNVGFTCPDCAKGRVAAISHHRAGAASGFAASLLIVVQPQGEAASDDRATEQECQRDPDGAHVDPAKASKTHAVRAHVIVAFDRLIARIAWAFGASLLTIPVRIRAF
jgi:hypothetical protein